LICAFGALVSGCARGVAEYQLYLQAFNLQYAQGDAILDSVAGAERVVVMDTLRIRARGRVIAFDPNKAAYYVDNIDPPITGSIRASFKALKSYNEALGGLANGEAAEALTNRIGNLATNVVGAIAATEVTLAGGAAIPGAGALVSQASNALKLASPILKQITTFAGREVFRRQLIETYPAMRELVLALRNGTPAMFEILRRSRVQIGALGVGSGGITPDRAAALEKDRQLLAGWVVLMDKTLAAMELAAIAAADNSPDAGLAALSENAIELRVLAEQIKNLRTKP
jgi:hypothetical protein